MLPAMKVKELQNNYITATERYSRAAARYTEASLVKKLEELGWSSFYLCTNNFYHYQ
jgi:DNA topoisomerase-1